MPATVSPRPREQSPRNGLANLDAVPVATRWPTQPAAEQLQQALAMLPRLRDALSCPGAPSV